METEPRDTGGSEDELREDQVTESDNLDDRVEEAEGLGRVREGEEFPIATAGGVAEGEDSSAGTGPASADPSIGQDPPADDE